MRHCLLVDADGDLRTAAAQYLQSYGIAVAHAGSGLEMRRAVRQVPFDIIVLSIALPDDSGLELCKWLRKSSGTPVVMLAAPGDSISGVLALELGADDYLHKPMAPRELVARIESVLRRAGKLRHEAAVSARGIVLQFSEWTLDRTTRRLTSSDDQSTALTSAEFSLLSAFVAHPRCVLSRARLIELIDADGVPVSGRSVDLRVSRLRHTLGDPPRQPALIRTVRGKGYLFDAEVRTLVSV